ncbi:MAG TPA: hypothetical protein PKV80_29325 [Leptospiraceae bacterium]|nr:hypothetical protein [Leptospiraceae bacterium]
MGLLKFSPDSWKYSLKMLKELGSTASDKMDMTSFLGNLLKRDYKISCIPVKGGWFEIDNENDLKVYEASFSGHI